MIEIESNIKVKGKSYLAEVGNANELFLGFEDHGLFMLNIDFTFGEGGIVQGLGRGLTKLETIQDIIRVFGVREWSKIKGRSIYVLRESRSGLILGFVSLDGQRYFLFD
jgi:hypothetical protein